MKTKTCTVCGEVKRADAESFHKNTQSKSGLQASCKVCRNAEMRPRSREYYQLHRATELCKRKRRYLLNKVEKFKVRCRTKGLQASGEGATICLSHDPIKNQSLWLGCNWVDMYLKLFNLKRCGGLAVKRNALHYREVTFKVTNFGRRPI